MENINTAPTEKPDFIRSILKLNEYVLGFTLVCYILGFVITNLFLGSFGVVNLDILRVRYILAGLLFGGFVSIIVFPIYGLVQLLIKHHDASVITLVGEVLVFTFRRYATITFLVFAISIFTMTPATPHIPLLVQTNELSWSDWFSKFPSQVLLPSLLLVFIVMPISIIIISMIIILLISLIAFIRKPRKETLKQIYEWMVSNLKLTSLLKILIYGFLFAVTFLTLSSLLNFIGGNDVKFGLSSLPKNWIRFLSLAFLIYLLITTSLIFLLTTFEGDDSDIWSFGYDPTDKYYSWLFTLAWGITIVVPIYAFNIYPYLPQQIGGGEVVKVSVNTSDDLSGLFSNSNTDVYLLDHTSKGAIFLLVNTNDASKKTVEVADGEIKSITYELPKSTPSPTPTPTISTSSPIPSIIFVTATPAPP